MNQLTKFLSIVAIVLMASVAFAKDGAGAGGGGKKGGKPDKTDLVVGKILRIDGNNIIISAGKKAEAKEVTIVTDDKTTFTLDGKEAKLVDLQAGQMIKVTPATGTATSIEARTATAKDGKGGGKGGKDKGNKAGKAKGGL